MACYDLIIVGGGPAGLTCAQYSARSKRKTLVIEELSTGGQLMYIDRIDNYPGFESISGFELTEKLEKQALAFGSELVYDSVVSIQKTDGVFTVNTSSKEYTSKAVVLACGSKRKELSVPGEKQYRGHGVSYCATCDGPFFRNADVMVYGGSDIAIKEALYLTGLCSSVTLVYKKDTLRCDETAKELFEKSGKGFYLLGTEVLEFKGNEKALNKVVLKKGAEVFEKSFSGVFIFDGNKAQSPLIEGLEVDGSNFIKTDSTMKTNIDGVYACGDARNTGFRQIVTACSDGAVASHFVNEYLYKLSKQKDTL